LPNEYWQKAVFTDESKIQRSATKLRYWVPEDNKTPPIQAHRWRPSIMVWGTTTYEKNSIIGIFDGTTKATDYVALLKRRILKDLPMLHPKRGQSHPQNQLVFQQDGAKVHDALIQTTISKKGV